MATQHPLSGRRRGQGRPSGGPSSVPSRAPDPLEAAARLQAVLRQQIDTLRRQLTDHWRSVILTAVPGVDPALADAFAADAAHLSMLEAELVTGDDGTTIKVDAKVTDTHLRMIGNVERDHHWTTTSGLPSRYVRRTPPRAPASSASLLSYITGQP